MHGGFSLAHALKQLIVWHEASVDHPFLEPAQIVQHRLKFVLRRPSLFAAEFAGLHGARLSAVMIGRHAGIVPSHGDYSTRFCRFRAPRFRIRPVLRGLVIAPTGPALA
jgi:hypothetical protein